MRELSMLAEQLRAWTAQVRRRGKSCHALELVVRWLGAGRMVMWWAPMVGLAGIVRMRPASCRWEHGDE